MPKDIPQSLKIQKNLLFSTHPYLILLDIELPDNTKFYLVNNNEDIIFQGRTYVKSRFAFEPPDETFGGEIPTCKLHVADVGSLFEYYIQKYRGGINSKITIRIVNTADLDADYSSFTIELSIQKVDRDSWSWLTFTLGAPNPMIQEFLQFTYQPFQCNWVFDFKGAECGYTGSAVSCDGTLNTCRLLGNSKRFGGHLGLSSKGFKIAF